MNIQSAAPVFGSNYNTGYIGFTYVGGFVSSGVAYFERWHRLGEITATHALIVSGENECIEAHIDEGVARVSLAKYFDDPQCQVFFRKPRGWTPALGQRIAAAAAGKIGTGLIVADVAADTLAGHWANRLLGNWPNRLLSRWLNRPNRWICSELAAYALAQQPEFKGQGVLRFPLDTIDPQELFEDTTLFEDWQHVRITANQPSASAKIL